MNAFKERRHRERLRGIGAQAGAMAAFVLAPATGIARGVVDQLVDAAFAVVAERAAAAAAAATAAAAAAAAAEMKAPALPPGANHHVPRVGGPESEAVAEK